MPKFPNLGEFRFVDSLLQNAAPLIENPPSKRCWLGVGDDAAIFDGWLATKDLSVENTHFRLDWGTPEQSVEKHIVSNVSDISAMGGRARIALLGLCINRHWPEEVRIRVRNALSEGFARRGITLIGGDTVSGDEGLFSTTLLGELASDRPLLRSNVKENYNLYINGTIGKSGAGLWLLMNHPEDRNLFPDLVEYHLSPKIHEAAGAELAKICADNPVNGDSSCACMDISDGLSSELNHLAVSSGVSLEIDEKLLPIDPEVLRMSDYYGISPMVFAMNGGEEYELLFANSLPISIFRKNDVLGEVYRIGSALGRSSEPTVYMRSNNGVVPVKPQAWSHL